MYCSPTKQIDNPVEMLQTKRRSKYVPSRQNLYASVMHSMQSSTSYARSLRPPKKPQAQDHMPCVWRHHRQARNQAQTKPSIADQQINPDIYQRHQLTAPTQPQEDYMKIRTKGAIRLPMPIDHNSIHQRIKDLSTIGEKRELVGKTNPFLYAFGKKLKPASYADYLARQGNE